MSETEETTKPYRDEWARWVVTISEEKAEEINMNGVGQPGDHEIVGGYQRCNRIED